MKKREFNKIVKSCTDKKKEIDLEKTSKGEKFTLFHTREHKIKYKKITAINGKWAIKWLLNHNWKLLRDIDSCLPFVYLKYKDGEEHYNDTWITLTLEYMNDGIRLCPGTAELHTRSKAMFQSHIHIDSYCDCRNMKDLINLEIEALKLKKLQNVEI